VCGTVWNVSGDSESVLCLGKFGVGFGGLSLCCVWESLRRVWGSVFLKCVGDFGAGFGE